MRGRSFLVVAAIASLTLWAASRRTGVAPRPPVPQIQFEHIVVDPHSPENQQTFTAGDIAGRGQVNVVTSGSTSGKAGLYWYEYPTWSKHTIDTAGAFSDDMQLVDVDGDGDLDIVVPEIGSKQIRWYENPRPRGNPATDPWIVHVIGNYGKYGFETAHDVEVGDLNGDGKIDVVVGNQKWDPPRPQNQPQLVIYFQGDHGAWTEAVVSDTYGEGTAIADLNGDGRPDIVRPGYWLEAPDDPVHGKWQEHWFARDWPDRAGVTVADINHDGRAEVLMAPAESRGRLSWFEVPRDPVKQRWTEHVIDPSVDFVHTFKVADMDGDGTLDVVFAEMQQSTRKRVGFFRNLDGAGKQWQLEVVATTGSHNIRVLDVDRDGDMDIIGANYDTNTDPNHAPMEIWRNLLNDEQNRRHLPLDKWTHIQVDDRRARWGDFQEPKWLGYFGLAAGDVNRDGFVDIVSGRYFYRNPGGDMTAPWSRVMFPVNADGMLLVDVDGDGQLDVIAEAAPDVYWLKPLDPQGDTWQPIKIGTIPKGTDWNGQGYAIANLVPGSRKPQILLSSAEGLYYFEIPDEPQKGNWPRTLITAEAFDEGIGVADVNGDGHLDISSRCGKDGKTLAWWENPGNGKGNWIKHVVGQSEIELDRNIMADLNGDGKPDIVVTEENAWHGASVYWFEHPLSLAGNWIRHTIVTQFTTNSLGVADMNNDGALDLVTAEHRGSKKLQIWESAGHGASWIEHVVSSGIENHEGALPIDLDGDGDLDLVGIAWDASQVLNIWRNDARMRLGGARNVETPVIAPNGGKSNGTFTVTVTTQTPGATIRYTLDGSDPDMSASSYTGPLVVAGTAKLKARAFKQGLSDSGIAAAAFETTYHY